MTVVIVTDFRNQQVADKLAEALRAFVQVDVWNQLSQVNKLIAHAQSNYLGTIKVVVDLRPLGVADDREVKGLALTLGLYRPHVRLINLLSDLKDSASALLLARRDAFVDDPGLSENLLKRVKDLL